ncbi:hypothetical protein GA0070616_0185 [Micromonospora nigra]|uniref:Uncharacterized protein n=1 Tax=Micromonospora nigra TaxID=145857 RepID=A0A1C6R9B1_9ACTN|nr:hypothetical protein [Micromonospora nigra]SCL13583.1 hypothetical protein GA0070616_0185 [Micromonospora nigra]
MPTRPRLLAVALVAALSAVGCSDDPEPQPAPELSRKGPTSTIARAELGDRLTVTASVGEVVADGAFVVRDVDLTNGVLLVLTPDVPPQAPQLVTVRGTVVSFDYDDLTDRYRLGGPAAYRDFEGRRVLAAEDVQVWR